MPSKKSSQTQPSKYQPLTRGILFVVLGFVGIWMTYDALRGATWMFRTSFSSFLFESLGRNGAIFVLALATAAFFVGGLWAIINAVIDLRKNETSEMR